MNYGLPGVTSGWTTITDSKLVGISITPNEVLEEGGLEITVLVDLNGIETPYETLKLLPSETSKVSEFDEDIQAGSTVTIQVERIGEVVKPYTIGAGVILQLEQ